MNVELLGQHPHPHLNHTSMTEAKKHAEKQYQAEKLKQMNDRIRDQNKRYLSFTTINTRNKILCRHRDIS